MVRIKQVCEYTCDLCDKPIVGEHSVRNKVFYHPDPRWISSQIITFRSGKGVDLHQACFDRLIRESTKTSDTD